MDTNKSKNILKKKGEVGRYKGEQYYYEQIILYAATYNTHPFVFQLCAEFMILLMAMMSDKS